jgi:hypothetical protein
MAADATGTKGSLHCSDFGTANENGSSYFVLVIWFLGLFEMHSITPIGVIFFGCSSSFSGFGRVIPLINLTCLPRQTSLPAPNSNRQNLEKYYKTAVICTIYPGCMAIFA